MTSKPTADRIAELQRLIPAYRDHVCSEDEQEGGECPVCVDLECMENELRNLTSVP